MTETPYTVVAPLWHRGLLRVAGETITMTPGEAKYRGADVLQVDVVAPDAEPTLRRRRAMLAVQRVNDDPDGAA